MTANEKRKEIAALCAAISRRIAVQEAARVRYGRRAARRYGYSAPHHLYQELKRLETELEGVDYAEGFGHDL